MYYHLRIKDVSSFPINDLTLLLLYRELLEFARLNMEDYKRPEFVVSFPLEIDGTEKKICPLTIGGKVNTRILPDPWDVKRPETKVETMRAVKRATQGMGWSSQAWTSPAALEAMQEFVGSVSGAGRNSFVAGRVSMKRATLACRSSRMTGRVSAAGGRKSVTVTSMEDMMKGGKDLKKTENAMKDLTAMANRASVALKDIIPEVKVNDEPVREDMSKDKSTEQAFEVVMDVVKDLLKKSLGDEVNNVTADDDFFALGLTSLDVPRRKYEVKHQLGKDISMEQIFMNPTVNRIAMFLSKPPEESGADLEMSELMDVSLVKDKPFSKPVVWILTLFCSFLFHAVTICFMTFLVILQFVYVHEASKCSPRGTIGQVDSALQTHCTTAEEGLDLWNA